MAAVERGHSSPRAHQDDGAAGYFHANVRLRAERHPAMVTRAEAGKNRDGEEPERAGEARNPWRVVRELPLRSQVLAVKWSLEAVADLVSGVRVVAARKAGCA
jgi:hypothetical protein